MNIEFETAEKKRRKPKTKFWACTTNRKKCLTLIADGIKEQYPVCPFCGGTEWEWSKWN
jgi:hypothetical protein